MKRTLIAGAIAALAAFNANALVAGDLAFTSFNADEDGWSMVALSNIAANTTVFFTDNEWSGTAFNGGESFHRWTSGASQINAGTVIRFTAIDVVGLAASVGTLARESVTGSTNYGISQTEDSVYAYLGTSATAPTTFLAGISTGTFNSASAGFLTNTGLSIGNGALTLQAGSDYAEYNGARSGEASFAAYKVKVSNVAQWTDSGDGSFATKVPDTTAFAIAPVPEPETYALLLAGLGLIGGIVRRRAARAS